MFKEGTNTSTQPRPEPKKQDKKINGTRSEQPTSEDLADLQSAFPERDLTSHAVGGKQAQEGLQQTLQEIRASEESRKARYASLKEKMDKEREDREKRA
ncbi:hypothetical protein KKC88_04535 [Patescibacteria group bacterium]|nr:hypothetical protein [Patescibacteria group bacterium]MBU1673998.1 hypothetical protein [Patescibacteria group bacterium]MBU1962929.1 hypothetical protein [Patescibacteria group bacterium]